MTEQVEIKKRARSPGWRVFIGLALLTGLEFLLSATLARPLPALIPVALIKAALILIYFMHIGQLWQAEEHS